MGDMAEHYSDGYSDMPEESEPPITTEQYDRLRREVGLEPVQTPQEAPQAAGAWWDSWPVPFAVLASARRVRVAMPLSARAEELYESGFTLEAEVYPDRGWSFSVDIGDLVEPRPCKCGCGLPCPVGQSYADTDFCRKREYLFFRPSLDLRGMDRAGAVRAMALVGEAVRAAKLGQVRATVDERPVKHKKEIKADRRPSNRIRLDAGAWNQLEEIRAYWGRESPTAAVRELIRAEKERITYIDREGEAHE